MSNYEYALTNGDKSTKKQFNITSSKQDQFAKI